ncbi:MAG: adenylyltransferase/cytidyltransferase family protein [Fibrobacteres bacterium]|nr:adenylyltransferase/cytidyltransferase family protein [Fibrobacterota bacterium]
MDKIVDIKSAERDAEKARVTGLKVVTTNGCFDLLHPGHIAYLEEAKEQGDLLFVAVNSDSSVKENKGDLRPVNSERDRCRMVASLACVDKVFIFNEKDPRTYIKIIKPAIHVKGGDYSGRLIEQDAVEESGGIVRLLKFLPGYSTTELINRISKAYKV